MKARAALALVLLAAAGCHGQGPLVAFLGDSLTAGWRIRRSEAFPALLAARLRERGRPIRVLDAGVSGETVAQGRARLPGVLSRRPDVVVVALGINDGLRGLAVEPVEAGLGEIVLRAREAGAQVLLVGMRVPFARDQDYARRFAEVYPRVAASYKVPLVPYLLEGVAGRPELLFPDRIHPLPAGHERLAENVRPHLELLLAEVAR